MRNGDDDTSEASEEDEESDYDNHDEDIDLKVEHNKDKNDV